MAYAPAVQQSLALLFRGLADVLMPPLCVTCKVPVVQAHHYCSTCWGALPAVSEPVCDSCAIPLPIGSEGRAFCLACQQQPPPFDRARAAFLYEGSARLTAIAFKNGRQELAPLMGRAMARAAAPLDASQCLIVPVPLHRWRLLARGYNQSVLLARAVAREVGREPSLDLLVRKRATARSKAMTKAGRRRNVRGAFAVPDTARAMLAGARVLLVDDVMTSGATAAACARTLKRAGASEIFVLVYARVAASSMPAYLRAFPQQDSHGEG